jgi:hypothetical protein
MGKIIINTLEDIEIEYAIKSKTTLNKVKEILKKEKKVLKTKMNNNEVIGLWENRFDKNISSANIQRKFREKIWKRF